jgi:hypothetical protein
MGTGSSRPPCPKCDSCCTCTEVTQKQINQIINSWNPVLKFESINTKKVTNNPNMPTMRNLLHSNKTYYIKNSNTLVRNEFNKQKNIKLNKYTKGLLNQKQPNNRYNSNGFLKNNN